MIDNRIRQRRQRGIGYQGRTNTDEEEEDANLQ
jgi:hypothetical protein